MAKTKDYYHILGVDQDAEPDEIKKAFIQLAEEVESQGDSRLMEDLQEAFKVLSNPKRRRLYDNYRQGAPTTDQLNQMTTAPTGMLPTNQSAKPVRWEYLTLKSSTNYGTTKYFINDDLQSDLKNTEFVEIMNTLGSDGWELVGISTVEKEQTFVFKRPADKVYVPKKKGPAA